MKKSYVEGGKNKVSNRVLKERKPNPKVNLGFDDGSHTNINNTNII